MKRLLRENVANDGRLNSDQFQRAVMQYRNTPDRDTGRSPAQVIFGRELRDFLPAPLSRYKPHPRWLLLQEDREKALRRRALRNTESLSHHTRLLKQLAVGDIVQIQNQMGHRSSRWDLTGVIVEVKSHDQYPIKVHGSGRLTLRNRKFIKKIEPYGTCDLPELAPWRCDPEDSSIENRDMDRQKKNLSDNSPNLLSHSDEMHHSSTDQQDAFEEIPDIEVSDPVEDCNPLPSSSSPDENLPLRRSSRNRAEPDRLNVTSWKGKSCDSKSMVLQEI